MSTNPFGSWPTTYTSLYLSDNAMLNAAIEVLPCYQDRVAQLRRLADALHEIRPSTVPDQRAALIDQVLADSAAGDVDMSAVMEKATTIERDDRCTAEARGVITAAGQHVRDTLDETVSRSADRLLSFLHDQLQQVLSQIREDSVYHGTAEQAIAAGQTEAYERTVSATQAHTEIRNAQRQILSKLSSVRDFHRDRLAPLYLGDILTVFPNYWRKPTTGQPAQPYPPMTDDLRPFTIWCAEHPEAKPWVPTLGQYENYQQTLEQARSLEAAKDAQRRRSE